MYSIPIEILYQIYNQLDINDLNNCSLVCKQWHILINDIYLWLPKCYKKLQKFNWIDSNLLNLLKLCGIYDINILIEKKSIKKYNKQLHNKSGYYMRRLFYYLQLLSTDYYYNNKNDIHLYHNENSIDYYKCIMIGPGIDSSILNRYIIKHILNWSIMDQLPDDFIITNSYLGIKSNLIGKNIMIQLPKLNNYLFNTLIKMTCIIPQHGELLPDKNRISGEYLLHTEEIDCNNNKINLLPEISILLKDCHLILYILDIRKSIIDDLDWEQITKEIIIILNDLNVYQSLLIIGAGNENGEEECITLVDLVSKLQCILFKNSTLDSLGEQMILKIPNAQWRVWLTTSNGMDYDNFAKMINWGLYRNNDNYNTKI
ncbi:unnamed protein product [Schistosoma intercalatum]|uniref:F-box domain-containing protein n=1 Tax=Schistosoma bovis TaxID=6184 RepID=A0A430QN42_SCHBO|nr:uncharacterized protein DC041_0007387 [Schistosoma bovis]CAH8558597.1 unnamed protein product [Schistosoma intercalatum]CAH8559397.1 unnamed protein product [Schistosoma intercalatum]